MKVVVTGSAGLIGADLCRALEGAVIERVVALDDLSTGRGSNLEGIGADLVEGSILDADILEHVCDGADAVVDLVARPSVPRSIADPMASHLVNATGTVSVLEAAQRAGVGHVIVASSSSVYGANPCLTESEDMFPQPRSPHVASKLATRSYALSWVASLGLRVLAFRFFNVFGLLQPADDAYAAVIPRSYQPPWTASRSRCTVTVDRPGISPSWTA